MVSLNVVGAYFHFQIIILVMTSSGKNLESVDQNFVWLAVMITDTPALSSTQVEFNSR